MYKNFTVYYNKKIIVKEDEINYSVYDNLNNLEKTIKIPGIECVSIWNDRLFFSDNTTAIKEFWPINNSSINKFFLKDKIKDFCIYKNFIYYFSNNEIIEYDIFSKNYKTIFEVFNIKNLKRYENLIIWSIDKNIFFFDALTNNVIKYIELDFDLFDVNCNKIILLKNNSIKEYSLMELFDFSAMVFKTIPFTTFSVTKTNHPVFIEKLKPFKLFNYLASKNFNNITNKNIFETPGSSIITLEPIDISAIEFEYANGTIELYFSEKKIYSINNFSEKFLCNFQNITIDKIILTGEFLNPELYITNELKFFDSSYNDVSFYNEEDFDLFENKGFGIKNIFPTTKKPFILNSSLEYKLKNKFAWGELKLNCKITNAKLILTIGGKDFYLENFTGEFKQFVLLPKNCLLKFTKVGEGLIELHEISIKIKGSPSEVFKIYTKW